jgi:hypothetical protein
MKHPSAPTVRRLALPALALLPCAAEACASCMSSASGDQTFTWAYYGLMATPFLIVLGLGGVLTGCYLSGRRGRPAPADSILDEETT